VLDRLRRLVTARPASHAGAGGRASAPADVRVAAVALLLELAYADGHFTADERAHIEAALDRHFGLAGDDARALMAEAERQVRAAVDQFGFTRQLVAEYDLGQRMLLAELMWGVILADGTLDDHEAYLVRKLANLLQLEPAYLSEARRKASEIPNDTGD